MNRIDMGQELIKTGEYYNTLTDKFTFTENRNKKYDNEIFIELFKSIDTIIEFSEYKDFSEDRNNKDKIFSETLNKISKELNRPISINTIFNTNNLYCFEFKSLDILENFKLKYIDYKTIYTTLTDHKKCGCKYDKDLWFPKTKSVNVD
jgi:hypothetical protein